MSVKLFCEIAPDRVKSDFLGASKKLKSEVCSYDNSNTLLWGLGNVDYTNLTYLNP